MVGLEIAQITANRQLNFQLRWLQPYTLSFLAKPLE